MRYWPAILIPPIAFLTLLSGNYALVPWACATEARAPLHVASAVALAVALFGHVVAWREWRDLGMERPDDKAERLSWLRLLAVIGIMQSGLFTLAVAALWITQFVIQPCVR